MLHLILKIFIEQFYGNIRKDFPEKDDRIPSLEHRFRRPWQHKRINIFYACSNKWFRMIKSTASLERCLYWCEKPSWVLYIPFRRLVKWLEEMTAQTFHFWATDIYGRLVTSWWRRHFSNNIFVSVDPYHTLQKKQKFLSKENVFQMRILNRKCEQELSHVSLHILRSWTAKTSWYMTCLYTRLACTIGRQW